MSNLPPILPPVPGSLDDVGDKNRIQKLNQVAQAKRQQLAASEPAGLASQQIIVSTPEPASTPATTVPQHTTPLQYDTPLLPAMETEAPAALPEASAPVPPATSSPKQAIPLPKMSAPMLPPMTTSIPVTAPPVLPPAHRTPTHLPAAPPPIKPPTIKPVLPPRHNSEAVHASVPQIASQPVMIASTPTTVASEPISITQVEALYNSEAPQVYVPSPGSKTLYGWAQVAEEIKKILDYAPNTVIRLAIEGRGLLTIDPKYQAYQWSTPLTEFPLEIGKAILDPKRVEDGDPAILTQPGSEIGDILWLIGYNAFNGQRASWLNENERYKLQKWPNLTSLGIGMEVVLISATLGNTPASAEELALSGGVSVEKANNIVNALSLMGLLSIHPYQGKSGRRFKGIMGNKNSLFNRLRARWGR